MNSGDIKRPNLCGGDIVQSIFMLWVFYVNLIFSNKVQIANSFIFTLHRLFHVKSPRNKKRILTFSWYISNGKAAKKYLLENVDISDFFIRLLRKICVFGDIKYWTKNDASYWYFCIDFSIVLLSIRSNFGIDSLVSLVRDKILT